ncbi:hypothetical protein [Granulicella mallensis]|uniref:Uncharacterized protein n=1 Tax=Granulicella mallensis TaxID=940614 RepID=A0A7W8E9P0_9BACT|nr:hypothetical protein [Granulicella mallensis]MBB5063901.1 hypothetical protein [Granulicella mallensis]
MSSTSVSDSASHRRDQIANFVELLSKSARYLNIARVVYRGKKAIKTVGEIAEALKKSEKDILTIARPMASQHIFTQSRVRINGKMTTAYSKDLFFVANRDEIFRLATHPTKRKNYATKTNPTVRVTTSVTIKGIGRPKIRMISIDDIDQFIKVKTIKASDTEEITDRLSEEKTKVGFHKILAEPHIAKDWPGETSDIYTSRISIRGRRYPASFALKGPAKKGKLVPGKMGKKGEQIQRLFQSPGQIHFVQYEGEIEDSVPYQMQQLATAKSLLGQEIFYGVIDDVDTRRIRLAYPDAFK